MNPKISSRFSLISKLMRHPSIASFTHHKFNAVFIRQLLRLVCVTSRSIRVALSTLFTDQNAIYYEILSVLSVQFRMTHFIHSRNFIALRQFRVERNLTHNEDETFQCHACITYQCSHLETIRTFVCNLIKCRLSQRKSSTVTEQEICFSKYRPL